MTRSWAEDDGSNGAVRESMRLAGLPVPDDLFELALMLRDADLVLKVSCSL